MDTNIDVTEGRADGAIASSDLSRGQGGSKEGPLTPVRGAAGAGGDELTPVSGTVSSNRDSVVTERTVSGSVETVRAFRIPPWMSELAEVENQARDVESEIRGLKMRKMIDLIATRICWCKQEQEAVASGRSYLDRTPVGGFRGGR